MNNDSTNIPGSSFSQQNQINYGPLSGLIGRWIGDRGLDIAPDANADPDKTAYIDEMTFIPAGPAENAESQQLVALRYHHLVRKKSNGQIFHDQIGHWIYEPETGAIQFSLSIPRGVCLLASGTVEANGEQLQFKVATSEDESPTGIVQSAFMAEKARTKAFAMEMTLAGNNLSYEETTSLFIYGKDFEHTDGSRLIRIGYDQD